MPSPLGHNRLILHLASELRPQLSLDVWGSVVKAALRTANMNLAKSVQSLADSACKALDDVRLDMHAEMHVFSAVAMDPKSPYCPIYAPRDKAMFPAAL